MEIISRVIGFLFVEVKELNGINPSGIIGETEDKWQDLRQMLVQYVSNGFR